MKSYIFQISKEPIRKDTVPISLRRYDCMVGTIADRVDRIRREDQYYAGLNSLARHPGIKLDPKHNTITLTSRKEYFERKYQKFKNSLMNLERLPLESFCRDPLNLDLYKLMDAHNNKCGVYLDDNDESNGLLTADNWARRCEENIPYYIGTAFVYHIEE